ncbi:ESPR-type extended signal peptide-containing protein, partial [Ignatzschineria ureiclastica]
MNRIFKVIWNNVLQRKVVTSELGKSQSSHSFGAVESSPILTSRPNRLWQALLLSGLLGISTVATAEPTLFALPKGCTLDGSGSELTCSGQSLLFTGDGAENNIIQSIVIKNNTNSSWDITNQGIYQNATMTIQESQQSPFVLTLEDGSYINRIEKTGSSTSTVNIEGSGARFGAINWRDAIGNESGAYFNYSGGDRNSPLYAGSIAIKDGGATYTITDGLIQFRPEDQWTSSASMVMNVKDGASIKLVDENNIPSDRVGSGTTTEPNSNITINLQGENSQIIFGKDVESDTVFNGQFRVGVAAAIIHGIGQIRVEDEADLYLNADFTSVADDSSFSGTVAIADGALHRYFALDAGVDAFGKAERIALEGEKSLLVLNYIVDDLDEIDDSIAFDYTITGAKDANGQWQANSAGSIVFNRGEGEEDLPSDTNVLLGANFLTTFRGDSLAFNGINYIAGADEDLFDAQKGMLENTTIKLGQAMGENATLTVAQNGMKLGGLEMANGAIFDISKQEKPTSDANIQTLGSLKLEGEDNTLIIGDDWIDENSVVEKEYYTYLDKGTQQNILKIENVDGLTREDIDKLSIKDSNNVYGSIIDRDNSIEEDGAVIANIEITTSQNLVQDSDGGEENYIAYQSFVSKYDIQDGNTLDLTITGDRNFRSIADIVGDGDLAIDTKDKTLVLAGNNYSWSGKTRLTGDQGGKVVLENSLADGSLTVKDIVLDVNGQDQKVDSLGIDKGVVDLNKGSLTLNPDSNMTDLSDINGTGNLRGVTKGAVNATSTDGINGSQLYQVGDDLAKALGGQATFEDGILTNVDFTKAFAELPVGTTITNVYDGFKYLDGRLVNLEENGVGGGSSNPGLIILSEDKQSLVVDNKIAEEATIFNIAGNKDGKPVARKLTGVAAGEISETSTDAINGSQLFVLGQGAAIALGGDAKFDKDGNLTMPNYKDVLTADKNLNSVEEGFEYVGGQLTAQGEKITNIEGDITNINSGKAGLVQVKGDQIVFDNDVEGANGAIFNVSSKDGAVRTIDGVKEAALNKDSNEAVSGKQLHATNERVTKNEGDITTIGDQITNITNNSGNSLTGIAEAFGAGAKFDENGNLTMPNYSEALGLEGDKAIEGGVDEGFKYVGGQLTAQGEKITNIEGDITNINSGKAGLVQVKGDQIVFDNDVEGANGATFNVSSKDGAVRTIDGVKEAALNKDSNEAVSGKQLHATNENVKNIDNRVTKNEGDITTIGDQITNITNNSGNSLTGIAEAFGAGAKFDENGNLTMPNYSEALGLGGDKAIEGGVEEGFKYVGGQLTAQGEKITNIEGDISNINSGKSGLVQVKGGQIVFNNEVEGANGATFNVSSKDGAVRTIDGVKEAALNKDSNEAVSGKQLHATNENVKNIDNRVTKNEGDITTIGDQIT